MYITYRQTLKVEPEFLRDFPDAHERLKERARAATERSLSWEFPFEHTIGDAELKEMIPYSAYDDCPDHMKDTLHCVYFVKVYLGDTVSEKALNEHIYKTVKGVYI